MAELSIAELSIAELSIAELSIAEFSEFPTFDSVIHEKP
jgi:hypothetical protein